MIKSAVFISFIFLCLHSWAQIRIDNLVINPNLEGSYGCCEYKKACWGPPAWFGYSAANIKSKKEGKTNKGYISVSPIQHIYGIKSNDYVFACLKQSLKNRCTYSINVKLSGNKKSYFIYTFTDTLVSQMMDSGSVFINNHMFDTIVLTGTNFKFKHLESKPNAYYLLFKIVDMNKNEKIGYYRLLKQILIVPLDCVHEQDSESIERERKMMQERRRHQFSEPCEVNTYR
jgi:hypothetical protein